MANVVVSRSYSVAHSPTLNTILMVEDILKKEDVLTVADLKKKLPRKVMHSTLMQILDYLQLSGKILITPKGIVWIFSPRSEIEKLKKRGIEL